MSPNPWQESVALPKFPRRNLQSNKGTFGKVLVLAGSRGMSGAAILSGTAALRGGAGLVRVAIPDAISGIVATAQPCYTTIPLPSDANGHLADAAWPTIEQQLKENTVVALGPGLGQSQDLTHLLEKILASTTVPVVMDADGLNAFAGHPESLRCSPPLILTPHPGEFSRLSGESIANIQNKRRELAFAFAQQHQIVLVLKGQKTIVTDGQSLYENLTGNPGLATGGSGDVLTGLLAALLAQKLEPFAAAQLAVHVHGLAADLAVRDLGEVSMIASDLLDYLPAAMQTL